MNEQTFRRLLQHCELPEAEQGCRDYLSAKFNHYLNHLLNFYIREYKVMNGLMNQFDEIPFSSTNENSNNENDDNPVVVHIQANNSAASATSLNLPSSMSSSLSSSNTPPRTIVIEFSARCIREIFTEKNGFVFVNSSSSSSSSTNNPASKLDTGRSQHNILYMRTFLPEVRKLLESYIESVDRTISNIHFTEQGRILLINICEAYVIDCIQKAKIAMKFRARSEKPTSNMRLMSQDLELCTDLQNRELRIEVC